MIFTWNGHWQIAAAAQGSLKEDAGFDSPKQALQAGQFFSWADRPDF